MQSHSSKGVARRRVLYLAAWNVQAIHEGIVAYAHEAGWILNNAMCFSGLIPEDAQPDGVICRHAYNPAILAFTRRLGVPAVGFEEDPRMPLPRVYYDEEAVGALAARHLIQRGHKTLGFLHLHFTPYQLLRRDGFRREVEQAGLRYVDFAPQTKPDSWHAAPGPAWDWLDARLQQAGTPVGIMATNDQIARPLIDALVERGYRVPEDVAVVGAENDPLVCDIAAVSISSVDTRTRQIGYEAARMLDRIMSGEAVGAATLRIAPSHVVTRDSTDALAIANAHAAHALHFIWRHYRKPIRIDDIAGSVSITRRRLQTLFLQELGRTMQEEITRVRTAHACRLLSRTALKINIVAQQSGFSTSLHLHRTFQNLLKTGPKAFREGGFPVPDLGVLPASAENAGA